VVERADLLIASARRRLRSMSREEGLVAGVRRHDRHAFEAVYERHAPQLLNFCIYLTGSRADAEDALQATFISAYRALLADTRPVALRPWLFTIARNECLTIIRKRRNHSELNGEVALTGDPVRHAEVSEDLVGVFDSIRELPERQRAALVLAEFNGMSHAEIGSVLGVRAQQVKAYVYQARTHLLTDRNARDSDCHEIREELANADGVARLRARLRRHLRSCDGCRAYANGVETQRHQFAALMPLLPALTLKFRALEDALGIGSSNAATYANTASIAGSAVEVGGAGMTALVAKVAAGVVAIGASAGVGVSVMSTPQATTPSRASAVVRHHTSSHAMLASVSGGASGSSRRSAGSGGSGGRGRLTAAEAYEGAGRGIPGALRLRGEAGGAAGEALPAGGDAVRGETFATEVSSGVREHGGSGSGSGSPSRSDRQAGSQELASTTVPEAHRRAAIERREAREHHQEQRLAEKAEHELRRAERHNTGKGGGKETGGGSGGGSEEEGTKAKKSHGLPKGHKKVPKEGEEETGPHKHKKHKHKREHKTETGGEGEGEKTP
jgi:RNA polymerase sigma factor (sigma-70 family)